MFIYSSIDVHEGCFHLLALVNNVAMNMGGQIPLEVLLSILLDIYPQVGLLDHTVFVFNFLRNLYTVFIVDAQFYIPTSNVQEY